MQFSSAVRTARNDVTETTIGTSPQLVLLTGSQPANPAASETGTRVAVMTLPSDWMANAVAGVKAKAGTWQDAAADAGGTVAYFRVYDSAGTTCHIQGSVTITGGGGEITLDNNVVVLGQQVTITSFTITEGNA